MAINTVDRSNNPITLNTNTPTAGQHVGTTTLTDAASGAGAAVPASAIGAGNQAVTGNALQVNAVPQLSNFAGQADALKKGGADLMAMRGIAPSALHIGTRYTATSTTTLSSASTVGTLSVANTTGFKIGGTCNFEPGTSRYETAEITAVVANTSVSVAFPSGGSAFTHTASYTIETFDASVGREAPGRQGALLVSADGTKPTYRAGAVGQTLYSTGAAVLLEIVGSASETVRLKRIELWGQAATKFYTELQLLRCTAASAGSANTAVLGQHDGSDAAATAAINYYTAAAASGTGHSVIGAKPMTTGAPSATLGLNSAVWDFSRNQDKALILRGTGDVIEIYNTVTALGTATFGFEVEWEEDNS